jgi:hypothetical protein
MRNIAVICRNLEIFHCYIKNQVAIDIDNLWILSDRVVTGNWTYYFVNTMQKTRGIEWSYYLILGPMGKIEDEICNFMHVRGVELLPTFKIKEDFYGTWKPLESFPG